MITLNDYLYSGNTLLKILRQYEADLRADALAEKNEIDLMHCDFLNQIMELLQHNDFLTAQSQKIREFYKYMAKAYPYLAFTFKGRIKSLIRAESKFNGYILEYMYEYYKTHQEWPSPKLLEDKLNVFRDLIAYRIVLSMPRCHLDKEEDREQVELRYIYEIANILPEFMKDYGFIPEPTGGVVMSTSPLLNDSVKAYYRDYISNPSPAGYQSMHITFYDHSAHCYLEIQLRTKQMDDVAEIGAANHWGYEKRQDNERSRRDLVPEGENIYFDQAHERVRLLQELDLSQLDVNMFGAVNNSLINDGCGLYRGRLILPYEHLSGFQNDDF